ncbi:MaoC family dehydratase [Amorphus sp. 3PC139-8]|uniref:MaoC family dehydratase n=1 Tax=Amorphus sp. 3PC139-8 TaxID=2735676 RepID=UPI00345CCF0C
MSDRGGLYLEDFVVGTVYRHTLRRTVTEADNMLFSNMTLNPQPLHIDRHYCETETDWGQPLVNSLFTLGLLVGISVSDLTVGTTIANLAMSEVRFPAPVFHGDTIRAETVVLGKRESKSRPNAGILELEHTAYNQNDVAVAISKRTVMVRRKPQT